MDIFYLNLWEGWALAQERIAYISFGCDADLNPDSGN